MKKLLNLRIYNPWEMEFRMNGLKVGLKESKLIMMKIGDSLSPAYIMPMYFFYYDRIWIQDRWTWWLESWLIRSVNITMSHLKIGKKIMNLLSISDVFYFLNSIISLFLFLFLEICKFHISLMFHYNINQNGIQS